MKTFCFWKANKIVYLSIQNKYFIAFISINSNCLSQNNKKNVIFSFHFLFFFVIFIKSLVCKLFDIFQTDLYVSEKKFWWSILLFFVQCSIVFKENFIQISNNSKKDQKFWILFWNFYFRCTFFLSFLCINEVILCSYKCFRHHSEEIQVR